MKALHDVGDASRGQWEEWSGTVYHVKRRLSSEEQAVVGEAKDIRGTQEAEERRQAMQCYVPSHVRSIYE